MIIDKNQQDPTRMEKNNMDWKKNDKNAMLRSCQGVAKELPRNCQGIAKELPKIIN